MCMIFKKLGRYGAMRTVHINYITILQYNNVPLIEKFSADRLLQYRLFYILYK